MGAVEETRVLGPADEARVVTFLLAQLESSMILLSNIEKAGLRDEGKPFQGTYVGHVDASGALTAVAAHYWNRNIILQGDRGIEAAARLASERSGRAVQGLLGPWSLVERARGALGMRERPAQLSSRELLFALDLDVIVVPELLSQAGVAWRLPTRHEAETLLSAWRLEYCVEALGSMRSAELEKSARGQTLGLLDQGNLSVLVVSEEVVAMTGFNSATRGVVQVGNVYTPPALRSRGYARAALAGSLLAARAAGMRRSTLFTGESQLAAQRAYLALGYHVVGDYGIVLFS